MHKFFILKEKNIYVLWMWQKSAKYFEYVFL